MLRKRSSFSWLNDDDNTDLAVHLHCLTIGFLNKATVIEYMDPNLFLKNNFSLHRLCLYMQSYITKSHSILWMHLSKTIANERSKFTGYPL